VGAYCVEVEVCHCAASKELHRQREKDKVLHGRQTSLINVGVG